MKTEASTLVIFLSEYFPNPTINAKMESPINETIVGLNPLSQHINIRENTTVDGISNTQCIWIFLYIFTVYATDSFYDSGEISIGFKL